MTGEHHTAEPAEVPSDSAVLRGLAAEGVSFWLAGLSRAALADGSLKTWIADAHITGLVLSPSVMTCEIRRTDDHAYRDQLSLLARRHASPEEMVRALIAYDARWACDLLSSVHTAAEGLDGWVCVELDARLAYDRRSALEEARALALAVNRPNLLVTVAATDAGLDVVRECVADGIGVNAALIHSVERYGEVLDSYWEGLERSHEAGRDPARVPCVATWELAEVEAAVDERLRELGGVPDTAELRSRTALALARTAYDLQERRLDSHRWRTLRNAGARPHRLVWSGAGVGDGSSDPGHLAAGIRQVEEIVAWRTAHVLTRGALTEAARRARPRGDSLTGQAAAATDVVAALRRRGVHLGCLAENLERLRLRRLERDREELLDAVQNSPAVRAYR
ncbi:transaldolase family protein [Streptomyces adelaidensis]|uniref:transaldolase family protein n=1 Tax=Streptomyces adelaidensis TaxID=2796465 RepID=UPI001907116F|nr:transaldolase family protein [Streptomyces adelaidensis]